MFCFVSNQKHSNVPNHHTNIFFCLILRCEQIYFHLTTFLWSASPLHYNLSTVSHGVTHASSFCHAHNSLRAHLFILHLKIGTCFKHPSLTAYYHKSFCYGWEWLLTAAHVFFAAVQLTWNFCPISVHLSEVLVCPCAPVYVCIFSQNLRNLS